MNITVLVVLVAECTHCRAAAGHPCTDRVGNVVSYVHLERTLAAGR